MAFRNFTGCAIATIAAGPVFVASVGVAVLALSPGPIAITSELTFALMILLPAIVIGAIIAAIPVTVGAMAMGWLGDRNPAFQLPIMWALAGAATAGGWTPFVSLGPDEEPFKLALAMTGAISALICRHWLVWAPSPARKPIRPPVIIA
ncbi:hypothetical protein LZK98_11320 [Sphingomonas cannabina]|uniref:hypothetical protein n=1 Tax=Sphingomonas cannabina TaxID=2899123 RepID=UPI001F1926A9|nr:hypothetical protein [Sphingomonas cannabina]UIJ43681.1 hypothetical protein LZK98_11320 [Sphingomonas cannabina]